MLELINGVLWDKVCLFLLVFTGGFMAVKTRFFAFRHGGLIFRKTAKTLFSRQGGEGGISSFGAVCTALAATLGVGNIAGVSSALAIGGPGALFWMWVAAVFGFSTSYSENALGHFYRCRGADGGFRGGAMYFLKYGLGNRKGFRKLSRFLSFLFCFFCILASLGIGNASQINTIAVNMKSAFDIRALSDIKLLGTDLYSLLLGTFLALAVGAVLLGGITRLSKITEKIVPVMVLGYILGCSVIIVKNSHLLLEAICSVFRFAVTPRAALGGTAGAALSRVIGIGFRRGMFSSEAGLGSSVIVNSASREKESAVMGMWGIFEVFLDTILVCTVTALCVLCSGFFDLEHGILLKNVESSALVSETFCRFFGVWGGRFIAVSILLFAFATVLGWSYYGTAAWEFLFGGDTAVYKTVYILFILVGANIDVALVWALSDTANALMMIPNLFGVLFCHRTVSSLTQDYINKQKLVKRK